MVDQYYVYIMTDQPNGTLYVGMTNNLVRRVHEHREGYHPKGFTSRYNLNQLVHFEVFQDPVTAISREKRMKKWVRKWRTDLIETGNPTWMDLWPTINRP